MPPERQSTVWTMLLGAGILAVLVGAVFFPMLRFEFINLDVPEQLLANPHVQGLGGGNLWHILTAPCATSYYPVRTLTLALDYQLWGLRPAGFKLTNGLLHLGNVLLVYGLILRLVRGPLAADQSRLLWPDALAATVAAGLFAVHPVVVEPVVWVAGREELLMTLGALACVHFHLTARRWYELGGSRQRVLAFHGLAAGACALSCLSNAVGAVIPLLIVACDLLTLRGPKLRRILHGTAALWIAGGATVLAKWLSDQRHPDVEMSQTLSAMVERLGQADSVIGEAAAFSVERVLLVLNVFWLNLQTLVWPAHLSFSYAPVRPQYILEPQVILGLAAAGLCGATFWAIRRRKSMLLGLVWFGLALIPSAQILPHHIHRADRFLYLPLVGLALALAMGLRQFFGLVKGRNTAGGVAVACGLGLCLLGTLCAAQVQAWRGNLTLWESAVAGAPRSAFAHQCYAKTLAGAGESRRAFSHYEIALRLNPYNPHALKSLAEGLATAQDVNLRDYELAIRLAEWACTLTEWRDRELLHTLALVYNNTAVDLAENGRFDRAVDLYRKAVQSDPRYAAPAFNLSLLLATCPDRDLRQPDEAVRLAEEACQLLGRPDANGLMILAVAYEQAGRTGEAMATTQKAIGRADAAGDIRLAKFLRTRLRLFQNRDIPIQGGP